MTCQRCGTKFCYLCGAKRRTLKIFGTTFEDHDRKYSILGCNGTVHTKGGQVRTHLIRGSVFGKVLRLRDDCYSIRTSCLHRPIDPHHLFLYLFIV